MTLDTEAQLFETIFRRMWPNRHLW